MSKLQVLIDAEGYEVPVKYIDPVVLKRHKTVESIFKKISQLQDLMAKVKVDIEGAMKAHLDEIAESFGEKWQGNASLKNFDQTKECEIKISKRMEFDERLQIAKTKIDDCIKRWSKGSGDQIVALVNKAFKVDKKGHVDVKQILSLRSLDFKDKEWKEAMDIISDSIRISTVKKYYYFRQKNDKDMWITVPLDFSNVQ